jgi:predicted Rossmann fold nucleotide-binding protein DprA/Smf involved in DNA uptake
MPLAKPCIVLTTRQALARLASVGRIRRKADELERIRRKHDKIRRKYAELEAEGWRKHFQPISIQYRVLSALGDDCLTSRELAAVSMIPQKAVQNALQRLKLKRRVIRINKRKEKRWRKRKSTL